MRRRATGRTPMLRVIGALLSANLRRLARDRTGLVFIVAVPFLLILIIGVSTSGGQGGGGRPVAVVASTVDDGPTARLLALLEADPTLDVTRFGDVDEMTSSVRRRVHVAGVEIPADLTERLNAGERAEVRLHTDPSGTPALEVRTAVAQAVARVGASLRSARLVAARTGIAPEAVLRASESLPSFGATEVVSQTVGVAGSALPSGFAYSAPAYLVLFMFINTLVAAWGLPTDRQRGLTRRAFAAPTGSSAVLLGEWSYRLLVALLQAGLIVIVGAVLFGVDWGHPLAVAAIVVLFALSATGASVLLGSLARTPQQVTALAPPLGIALGMLGGCMWPLEIVGPTMRTLGHATPHAWAVDALMRVVGAGAGPSDIAVELIVLAAFAAGFLLLALASFRRTLLSARG
ncbi:MAG: ABC transporter permease [Trueperaceae bacterium]|nr:ABC transporter permease [Trueperaceae bacterium]